MTDVFFYGTLCHPPLMQLVLGRPVAFRGARLDNHAVYWAEGQSFPLILPESGTHTDGILVRGLSDEDVARLDFYETGFAAAPREVSVLGAMVTAQVYLPLPGLGLRKGARWRLTKWLAGPGQVAVATARDFMALFGQKNAAEAMARYPQMLVRGASRLRAAADPAPATLRRGPGTVCVEARREPYANYFAVEEYDLSFDRFDGSRSPVVTRAAFVSGDAATVLPYDPARDRVMVIEQFRIGPYARGDANPWLLEPIAGRVDPWETPADCARREAQEEAGLVLHELIPISSYYPSPGSKTEYLYAFLALTDLPDTISRIGGVAAEAEDIRSHVIPFARLMDLIATGEGANGPLILSALWLAGRRDRLRAAN